MKTIFRMLAFFFVLTATALASERNPASLCGRWETEPHRGFVPNITDRYSDGTFVKKTFYTTYPEGKFEAYYSWGKWFISAKKGKDPATKELKPLYIEKDEGLSWVSKKRKPKRTFSYFVEPKTTNNEFATRGTDPNSDSSIVVASDFRVNAKKPLGDQGLSLQTTPEYTTPNLDKVPGWVLDSTGVPTAKAMPSETQRR